MPPVTTKKRETYESKTRRAIVKLYTKFGDRPFTLGRLIAEVTAQGENGPHMLRIVPKNLAGLVQSHLLKLKGTLDDGEREFQFTPEGAHKIRVIANLEQNDAFGEGKFANAMLQSPQKMTKKKLQETNFLLAETIEEQQDTILEYRQRDKERLMNGAYISPVRTPVASPLRKTASLPAGYFTPQSRPPRNLVIPQRITEFPSPPSSPTPHDAMDVDNSGDIPMADSSDDDHFMSPLDWSTPGHDDDDNESDELQTAHFNITKQLADREAELNAAKTDIARLQGQLAQRDASIEELNLELSTADQLVEHYDDYLARADQDVADARGEMDRMAAEMARREVNHRVTNGILAQNEKTVDELSDRNLVLEQDLAEEAECRRHLLDHRDELEEQLQESKARAIEFEDAHQRVELELATSKRRVAKLEAEVVELQDKLKQNYMHYQAKVIQYVMNLKENVEQIPPL